MKTLFENLFPKDKEFLVTQMVIQEQTNYDTTMSNIIRVVLAKNKESAIGKYILATQSIVVVKKFDLQVHELSDIGIVK